MVNIIKFSVVFFTFFLMGADSCLLYAKEGGLSGVGVKEAYDSTLPKKVIFAGIFENETGQEIYDPFAASIGDLLAVMLSLQDDVLVVERQRLKELDKEQILSLQGLTGKEHAIQAGRLLDADTVLVGRLFLVHDKLQISTQALNLGLANVVASDQVTCNPAELLEAAYKTSRRLGKQLALRSKDIKIMEIGKLPIASFHFAKGLSHYYSGNMDSAIVEFMRTIDLDPDRIEASYWSGICYYRLGEYKHAIIEWNQFVKRSENSDEEKKQKAQALLTEAQLRQKESPVVPFMTIPADKSESQKKKSDPNEKGADE